ncbi:MAG: glutamine amidotransferase family protein [Candidatus Hydrothermarchaeota archaeon]|nr:glutamine amidotransferase family protein [Candidatus Hydrothermarchaeota archaeon]
MCGLAGILNKNGKRISGKDITCMADIMNDRYDGRGGGFAAYGIYPKYNDQYALHIFLDNHEARERTEEYLKGVVDIVKEDEVPTAKITEIPKAHETWRYFVDVPEKTDNQDDYIVKVVMTINNEIQGAYVASSGRNMGVFKATGLPCDVARLFKIDKYKAYCWTSHGRFPTNTRGWWGGAHPFNLLDWCVIHNGEISSYGTNKRYLETYGYKCNLQTDTEVVAYLFDLLVRKHGLSMETASTALTPPFWKHIDAMPEKERKLYTHIRMTYAPAMLNGPFGIIVTNQDTMIGLNDRIKLRPLIAAKDGDYSFIASEEAAIRSISKEPEKVWAPKAGSPVIARLENGLLRGG